MLKERLLGSDPTQISAGTVTILDRLAPIP
jgi:hypothetical protein